MGAGREVVRAVYHSNTANEAADIVKREGYSGVWNVLARVASQKCRQRVRDAMSISVVFIDGEGQVLGGYYDE